MKKERRFWQIIMVWDFNRHLDNTAVLDEEGNHLTYRGLQCESNKLAANIEGRCLVFILCKNRIGTLIGYTSCIDHKIVPLLLGADLDRELLYNLIITYQPDYLWAPMHLEEKIKEFVIKYRAFGYALLETGHKKIYMLNNELGLLLTTSGSTGSPKLVRQSYKNIFVNAQTMVQYFGIDSSKKMITTLPMNYTYGLSMVSSYLLAGAAILFTEKGVMQKGFWDFFKEAGATSFDGVPYIYEMLDKLQFWKMNLPSLQTMTQAGGKLSIDLHRKFAGYAQESGKKFCVFLGATEATNMMSYLSSEVSLKKYGSVGTAISGGKLYIIDNDGNELKKDDIDGELVYEGENVTLGYAECGEDLAKGDENHGCIRTGDIARFDKDGYCYIVGRKKRFLKIFGNRVNLDELDMLIKRHFPDLDCASTGSDDNVQIFITEKSCEDEIRSFISEKTGLHFSVFHIYTIEKIPRNISGKVMYKELELCGTEITY